MPALLIWTLLGIAGGWALALIFVLGSLPAWIAGAADGDLAELGILDREDGR
jgi:hypothetical protein